MCEQGGFRHLWIHRLSISSGEMPLSSPGHRAESPGEVSAQQQGIVSHGLHSSLGNGSSGDRVKFFPARYALREPGRQAAWEGGGVLLGCSGC